MWPLLLTTAGCMFVGFLLMGIPGALFMSAAGPLLKRLYGKGLNELGDRAWPIAILVSLGWPLAIAPSWLWLRSLTPSTGLCVAGTAGLCLVWGLLLAVLLARPGAVK
ncbi:MAG: hypothetical protein K8T20_16540 [Planctomycetes bacterium]|nr:hypothetical protein [Planctomycetota bacterium]